MKISRLVIAVVIPFSVSAILVTLGNVLYGWYVPIIAVWLDLVPWQLE
jgi:hypothetical protein